MKIAFVQPTEASLINRDFWYVINTDNSLEYSLYNINLVVLLNLEIASFD